MGRHDPALGLPQGQSTLIRGLYASTLVQTALGWRAAAELGSGDLVMTRDDGLRPIRSVSVEHRQALWSVRLPQGAFGNDAVVMLPPGQPILIKTSYAMPFSGDDLALVPVTTLEGWRGIAPHVPARTEAIVQIRLDRPGVLLVGPGLMAGCEGIDEPTFDIRHLLDSPTRPTLPLAAARHMVAHLVADEACAELAACQAAERWPPPNLS